MVTLKTPKGEQILLENEWKDVEDYTGWTFLTHLMECIGSIWIEGLYTIFWIAFGVWCLTPISQFIAGFVGRFVTDNMF
jgi:hypothetical protein